MNEKPAWLGMGLVVLSAICFAANSSSSVVAYGGGATPLSVVTFRVAFTAVVLYALLKGSGALDSVPTRDRAMGLGLGVFYAGFSYCLVEAFDRLPVALAILTFYIYPILIGITAYAIGRDRLNWALVAGLVVAFGGLALALDVTGGTLDTSGMLFAVAGAVSFTVVAIVSTPMIARHGDARPVVLDMHLTCVVLFVAISVIIGDYPLPTTTRAWIGFAVVPLFYTVATVSFFVAMGIIGPVRTGLVMNLEPIAAMVFGYVILSQALTPVQLVGAALVIAAVTAVKWDTGRQETGA